MQTLLNKKDTFHEAIALLIELRTNIFDQITQILNGYPEEVNQSTSYKTKKTID